MTSKLLPIKRNFQNLNSDIEEEESPAKIPEQDEDSKQQAKTLKRSKTSGKKLRRLNPVTSQLTDTALTVIVEAADKVKEEVDPRQSLTQSPIQKPNTQPRSPTKLSQSLSPIREAIMTRARKLESQPQIVESKPPLQEQVQNPIISEVNVEMVSDDDEKSNSDTDMLIQDDGSQIEDAPSHANNNGDHRLLSLSKDDVKVLSEAKIAKATQAYKTIFYAIENDQRSTPDLRLAMTHLWGKMLQNLARKAYLRIHYYKSRIAAQKQQEGGLNMNLISVMSESLNQIIEVHQNLVTTRKDLKSRLKFLVIPVDSKFYNLEEVDLQNIKLPQQRSSSQRSKRSRAKSLPQTPSKSKSNPPYENQYGPPEFVKDLNQITQKFSQHQSQHSAPSLDDRNSQDETPIAGIDLAVLTKSKGSEFVQEQLRKSLLKIKDWTLETFCQIWSQLSKDDLDKVRNCVAMAIENVQFDDTTKLNKATESEWIGRLLLYFMAMPIDDLSDSEQWTQVNGDALSVWKTYVQESSCPRTREAIEQLLEYQRWQPRLQAAFIDRVYPFILELPLPRQKQLRKQLGKEIYVFMADVRNQTTQRKFKVDHLLFALPLIMWSVDGKPGSQNWYTYLLEYNEVPIDKLKAFLSNHLLEYLDVIDFKLGSEERFPLVRMLKHLKEECWPAVYSFRGTATERAKQYRDVAIAFKNKKIAQDKEQVMLEARKLRQQELEQEFQQAAIEEGLDTEASKLMANLVRSAFREPPFQDREYQLLIIAAILLKFEEYGKNRTSPPIGSDPAEFFTNMTPLKSQIPELHQLEDVKKLEIVDSIIQPPLTKSSVKIKSIQPQSTEVVIVLAQLNCSWGKSVVAAGLAKHLCQTDPTLPVFIVIPTIWLKRQLEFFFPDNSNEQLVRNFYKSSNLKGGIYIIEHAEIVEIHPNVLAKSFVIIDEAHLVLHTSAIVNKLLGSDRVLGLSATFRQERGLRELKEQLESVGAKAATINPKTKQSKSDNVNLGTIRFDFKGNRWKGQWARALLDSAVEMLNTKKLPTLIVTKDDNQVFKVKTELTKLLTPDSEWRQKLGDLFVFTGDTQNAGQTQVMEKINDGDLSRAIVVTQRSLILGVNFWPQCSVISLYHPTSVEEMDQLCGRSQRLDPLGARYLTMPLYEGEAIESFKILKSALWKPRNICQSQTSSNGSDLRSEEIYLPMTHEQLAPIEKKRGEEEN